MKIFFIWLIAVFLLPSCTDDKLDEIQSELVIEGWIEDGGFPFVIVSRTLPINENERFSFEKDSLAEYVGKYAKVTVSDGDESVILTGKTNKNYFPPFIYTTGRMRGEAGKSYHLTVEWDEMRCEADCTIPESPLDVKLNVEKKGDNQFLINATFVSSDSNNYHAAFVQVDSLDTRRTLSRMSLLDYGNSMTINHGTSDEKYFKYGQKVLVSVMSMNKNMHEFWQEYDKVATFSSNPLFSYCKNLGGNVIGGIGYWAGYGVCKRGIVIDTQKKTD